MIQNDIYSQPYSGIIPPPTEFIPQIPSDEELSDETRSRLKDPFDNPTEYTDFRDDYSKILPWIRLQNYKIPLEPARAEKTQLKRLYSIGGTCMLLQCISAQIVMLIAMLVLNLIIKLMNPSADSDTLSSYMMQSSILSGLNMAIFVIANVLFARIGMKWSKTDHPPLFKTKGFNFSYAVEYCIIALAIWSVAGLISMGVEEIFNRFDITTYSDSMNQEPVTGIGIAVSIIYTCIMAPVTEEIFFRGMLLRVFSKASQRFAVTATALFFGLGHGNLPQFTLAFLLGLFLAHITLKHESIIPSIIVHMFINTSVTVISYVGDSSVAEGILNIVIIAAMIIGAVLLIRYRKADRIPSTTPSQARRGFAVAKTSVSFVSAIIVMFLLTLLSLLSN